MPQLKIANTSNEDLSDFNIQTVRLIKRSLQKKKRKYWSFTNTLGGGTPRQIYFRFFPKEKNIYSLKQAFK